MKRGISFETFYSFLNRRERELKHQITALRADKLRREEDLKEVRDALARAAKK